MPGSVWPRHTTRTQESKEEIPWGKYPFSLCSFSTLLCIYLQCFCGTSAPESNRQTSESECSITCNGDSTYKCGAAWKMNIYRIAGSACEYILNFCLSATGVVYETELYSAFKLKKTKHDFRKGPISFEIFRLKYRILYHFTTPCPI